MCYRREIQDSSCRNGESCTPIHHSWFASFVDPQTLQRQHKTISWEEEDGFPGRGPTGCCVQSRAGCGRQQDVAAQPHRYGEQLPVPGGFVFPNTLISSFFLLPASTHHLLSHFLSLFKLLLFFYYFFSPPLLAQHSFFSALYLHLVLVQVEVLSLCSMGDLLQVGNSLH